MMMVSTDHHAVDEVRLNTAWKVKFSFKVVTYGNYYRKNQTSFFDKKNSYRVVPLIWK